MTIGRFGAAGHSRGIDLLRGLAVLMVMIAHLPFSPVGLSKLATPPSVYPPSRISSAMLNGHFGVQLFLVISGYCIHARWARVGDTAKRVDFLPFWHRRLMRLYPPYAIVLAASLGLVVVGHQVGPGTEVPWSQLAVDLALLVLLAQNVSDASAHVGNGPFWSLALEEHLYLLYFPLLYLRRTRGWGAALSVSLVTVGLWLGACTALRIELRWPNWKNMAFAYWFCWALGALAAEAHLKLVKLPRTLVFLAVLCASVGLTPVVDGALRSFIVSCAFFVVIVLITRLEDSGALGRIPGTRALAALGTISYAVYLVHLPTFIVVKRILVSSSLPLPVILVLRLTAGILVGYVFHRLVESPFQRRSQQILVRLVSDPMSSREGVVGDEQAR